MSRHDICIRCLQHGHNSAGCKQPNPLSFGPMISQNQDLAEYPARVHEVKRGDKVMIDGIEYTVGYLAGRDVEFVYFSRPHPNPHRTIDGQIIAHKYARATGDAKRLEPAAMSRIDWYNHLSSRKYKHD